MDDLTPVFDRLSDREDLGLQEILSPAAQIATGTSTEAARAHAAKPSALKGW